MHPIANPRSKAMLVDRIVVTGDKTNDRPISSLGSRFVSEPDASLGHLPYADAATIDRRSGIRSMRVKGRGGYGGTWYEKPVFERLVGFPSLR